MLWKAKMCEYNNIQCENNYIYIVYIYGKGEFVVKIIIYNLYFYVLLSPIFLFPYTQLTLIYYRILAIYLYI